MKQESIERLLAIQEEQLRALATQNLDGFAELESEKTSLLHEMSDFSTASLDQLIQLENILTTQNDLEKVCIEIRDQLGDQIRKTMKRRRAVSAYKDID